MNARVENRPSTQGSALIWALLFVIITAGMIVSHTVYMAANRKEMDVRYRLNTLAGAFARSGLTDAVGWFQRQANQPVTEFAPKYDPAGDPPLLDTIDPTLGLVREFEVRGNLWARYEIRKDEVFDISSQRGQVQPGSVWDVGARAYVYRRVDPGKPFDQAPNRVIAVTNVRTEMRGIPLLPPATAALGVDDPSKVIILDGARVEGGGKPAVAYPDSAAGGAATSGTGALSGTPPTVPVVSYDPSPEKVFSMRLDQLKSMSDFVVTGARLDRFLRAGKWKTLPENKVVFVTGNASIGPGRKLRGKALMVVDGDFATDPDSEVRLRGMLYVTGDIAIRGKFKMRGTMIGRNRVVLGGFGKKIEIEYEESDVKGLKKGLSRYRLGRSFRPFLFRRHH